MNGAANDVTRGEFELLKQIVQENGTRLTALDENGTRGVGVLVAQVSEVSRDLAELKADLKVERANRLSGRRWAVGLAVAASGSIGGLVVGLIEALQHAHAG